MNRKKGKKKVFVGMSGGVDSSLTAALLKKQDYDVVGVFIKVWQPDFVECSWMEDRLDAMRVCATLDIPFLDLDLEDIYKKEVFDYMINEYEKGRTPNPDVMCNKKIKFGGFLKFALEKGADYIATGHYVRLQKGKLLKGIDGNKDQSYFLWTLTQKQLKHCVFPIGEYTKPQVRKLAKKFNLSTAQKKESQGLCFVGKVDMKEFLERFIPRKKGNVLNQKGETIGEHDGVYYYTLGQRHGFEITKKRIDDKAYYIIRKDFEKNTLIVSDNQSPEVEPPEIGVKGGGIELSNVNWISGKSPDINKKYLARIRYRQSLLLCNLKEKEGKLIINFDKTQKTASEGQSVVIYDGDICLGGGVIN
ncbi:MAG: tRNA 2-thiouridine(34) synthase MnmA [Candidatus Pacebacteria bacterium]|nr:tRNA 2-thiouridine(34) synthase MnmA [Candidatus Paceibacterota bacterium]